MIYLHKNIQIKNKIINLQIKYIHDIFKVKYLMCTFFNSDFNSADFQVILTLSAKVIFT
jgi:hypothetical protein